MAETTNKLNLVLTATDKDLQAALKRVQAAFRRLGVVAKSSTVKAAKAFDGLGQAVDKATSTTEKNLDKVTASADKVGAKVPAATKKAGKALKSLGDDAKKGTDKALSALDKFGGKSISVMTRIRYQALNLKNGLLALSGALVLKQIIELSSTFERSMANIDTLLYGAGVSVDRYKKQLIDLSQRSSKDILDLSAALYQTISGGIPAIEGAAGAFAVLDAAQKAAVAGLSSTEDAVNALVTVLNAYGTDTVTAAEASDKLLKTVQLGRTTFPQLSHAIGRVAPVAAKFGVSLNDMLAVLVQLTRAGLNTNEAVTGLRAMIKGMAQPTDQTTKVLEHLNKTSGKAAVKFGAFAIQTNGLMGQIQALTDATGGSVEVLGRLFPNIRAVLPAMIAVGSGAEQTAGFIRDIGEAAGTTDAAVAKVAPTFSEAAAIFKSQIQAQLILAGEKSLPDLIKRFKELGAFLKKSTKEITAGFRAVFSAIDSVGQIVKTIGGPTLKILAVIFGAKLLRGFVAMLTGPVAAALAHTFGSMTRLAATASTLAPKIEASAGAASKTWVGRFISGIDTSMKGNEAALKRVFSNLPSLLGIAAVAWQVGTMLGKLIGDALAEAFEGDAMAEAKRALAKTNAELKGMLLKKGFLGTTTQTPEEQFEALSQGAAEGRLLHIRKARERRVNVELAIELAQDIETQLIGDLLSGKAKPKALIEAAAAPGLILEGREEEIERTVQALQKLEAELSTLRKLQRDQTGEAHKETLGKIDGLKKLASAERDSLVNRVRESALFQKKRERAEEIGLGKILSISDSANAKSVERYIDAQKLMLQEKNLRLAKGVEAEKAAGQARRAVILVIDDQIAQIEAKRQKSADEHTARMAEALRTLVEAGKIRRSLDKRVDTGFGDGDPFLAAVGVAAVEEAEKQRVAYHEAHKHALNLARTAQRYYNQIGPAAIKLLSAQKASLETESAMLAAQEKLATLEEQRRRAAEKAARSKRSAAKRRGALERYNRAIAATEQKILDLAIREARLAADRLRSQIELNKAAQDETTDWVKRAKLLHEQIVLEGKLGAARIRVAEKVTALEARKAREASRKHQAILKSAGKTGRVDAKKIAADVDKEAKRSAEELAVIQKEGVERVAAINADTARNQARAQKRLNADALRARKAAEAYDRRVAKRERAYWAKADKERLRREREQRDRFFDEDERRAAARDLYAKEQGVTQEKSAEHLFKLAQSINFGGDALKDAAIFAAASAARLDNLPEHLSRAYNQMFKSAFGALTSVSGILSADFNSFGEGLKKHIMDAAESAAGLMGNAFGDMMNVGGAFIGKGLDFATRKGGAISQGVSAAGSYLAAGASSLTGGMIGSTSPGSEQNKAIGDKIAAGFRAGASFASETLILAFDAIAQSIGDVFDSFVALLDKVLTSVLDPAIAALQEPLDIAFGALGEAVSALTSIPEEEARLSAARMKALEEERAYRLRILDEEGVNNEEVARIQAEFAARLNQAKPEGGSPFDVLNQAFDNALMIVDRVVEQLPALVEMFMQKLTEVLPEMIPRLVGALGEVVKVLGENLGPLLTDTITALFDALPKLIDALVVAIPQIIRAIIEGLTVVVERLPSYIEKFNNGIIKMLPGLLTAIIESLPDLIEAIVIAVPDIIVAMVKAIPQMTLAVIKAIPKIVLAIIEGLAKGITAIFRKLRNFGEDAGDWLTDTTPGRVTLGIATLGISELWQENPYGAEWLHSGGVVQGAGGGPTAQLFRAIGAAGYQTGGLVEASRSAVRASLADTVPALLQTGEGVLSRQAVAAMGGRGAVDSLNRGESTGQVNVRVGIVPSESGISRVVSALLPYLIGGVRADLEDGDSLLTAAIDGSGDNTLAFRGVPGR